MSTAHAVTRSVRDSAALLDVVQGADLGAPYAAPPPRAARTSRRSARRRAPAHRAPDRRASTAARRIPTASPPRATPRSCARSSATRWRRRRSRSTRAAFGARLAGDHRREPARARCWSALRELGRELRDDDLEPATRAMFEAAERRRAPPSTRARCACIHALGRQVARFLERLATCCSRRRSARRRCRSAASRSTNPDLPGFIARSRCRRSATRSSSTPRATRRCRCRSSGTRRGCRSACSSSRASATRRRCFRLAAQLEAARPWFRRSPALD